MAHMSAPAARLALGDRHDFLVVNNFARHTAWLHGAVTHYAKQGVVLFALLLIAGFLIARSSGRAVLVARAVLAGAGVLLAVAANQPVVHAVNEARPYRQLPHILLLVSPSLDASFPSDHAVMAGAVAAGLLFVHRTLGAVAVIAAVLMAFARVYVGAHFPVDVVAGLALGAAVAVLVQPAAALLAPVVLRLERGPLRRLVSA